MQRTMKSLLLKLLWKKKEVHSRKKEKYSKKDFDKWIDLWKDDKLSKEIMINSYDKDTELVLMYWVNHSQKQVQHIALYNTKDEILMMDDLKLLGNKK